MYRFQNRGCFIQEENFDPSGSNYFPLKPASMIKEDR